MSSSASAEGASDAKAVAAADRYIEIDPLKIRFTQKQAGKKFSCGRSVCDTILALRSGNLKPEALPPLRVVPIPPVTATPNSNSAAASASATATAPTAAAGATGGSDTKSITVSAAAAASGDGIVYWSLDNRRLFALQQWAKALPDAVRIRVEVVPFDSEFSKKRSNRAHGKVITISNLTFKEQLILL